MMRNDVHQYTTESGLELSDLGCTTEQACPHSLESVFDKRDEGRHFKCMSCCNKTALCNQNMTYAGTTNPGVVLPKDCPESRCSSSMKWCIRYLSQLMRFWYLSHRRTAKAQASLRFRAVSPEPLLFAHMKYGSRRRVRPKIRHPTPLDGCACAFEEWVYGERKVP